MSEGRDGPEVIVIPTHPKGYCNSCGNHNASPYIYFDDKKTWWAIWRFHFCSEECQALWLLTNA
jgi:hypothetical protein